MYYTHILRLTTNYRENNGTNNFALSGQSNVLGYVRKIGDCKCTYACMCLACLLNAEELVCLVLS